MSVSSGDFGGYSVSGSDADTLAPDYSYELLQEIMEIESVDTTYMENLLTGVNDKLTVIVLFCVVALIYTICRVSYKFLNGLFG